MQPTIVLRHSLPLLLLLVVYCDCFKSTESTGLDPAIDLDGDGKYTIADFLKLYNDIMDSHQVPSSHTPESGAVYTRTKPYSRNGWLKDSSQLRRKRSLQPHLSSPVSFIANSPGMEELRMALAAAANEINSNELLNEELLNVPISQLDLELAPLMQRLIRLLYYLQVKRSQDYVPRLGRRSNNNNVAAPEDCNDAHCLGKKDMDYRPRLGRRSG